MSDERESNLVAISALMGAVATLIQELVAAGSVDATSLRERLDTFVNQDVVTESPQAEKAIIQSVVSTLLDGIQYGEDEVSRRGKH